MSESEAEQPAEGEEEEEILLSEEEDATVAEERARILGHLTKKGVKIEDGEDDSFLFDIVSKQNAAAAAAAAEDRTAACHRQAKEIAAERASTSTLYSLVHFFENILEPYIVQKYGKDWVSRLAR